MRPSCLIIDEIGHCAFDKENTRLFFDLIDRRYNKEGSFNMIFTSNKNPALWREDFEEDATLLCTLDRIFDDATVFKLRGESFRGKKLETVSLQTGKIPAVESVMAKEYPDWNLGCLVFLIDLHLVISVEPEMVISAGRQHGQPSASINTVSMARLLCSFCRLCF